MELNEVFEPVCRKWIAVDGETGSMSCKWPPGQLTSMKLQGFVNKQVDPGTDWESHPCEVMSSYETYLGAHLGAKARESNPSYETEKDLGKGQRRLRKRKISTSEDEELEPVIDSQLLSPPQIKPAGGSKSFKPVVNVKSPLKVVASTSRNSKPDEGSKSFKRIVNTKSPLKVVPSTSSSSKMPARRDKGTKGSSVLDIKAILNARREEAKEKKKSVVCTSPLWKVEHVQEEGGCGDGMAEDVNDSPEQTPTDSQTAFIAKDKSAKIPNTSKVVRSLFRTAGEGTEAHRVPEERSASLSFSPGMSCGVSPGMSCGVSPGKSCRVSPPHSESSFNAFERKVLVGMNELKQMLQVISANQSKLNLHLLPSEKVVNCPEGMPILPVKTTKALEYLEKFLDVPDNVSNMSVYLSAYVSKRAKDEGKSAIKVMSRVISNGLASKFSLKVVRGKLAFNDLKLWSAVQGAILWKLETDLSNTEHAVGKWLKDAPGRKQESESPKKVSKSPKKMHSKLHSKKNDKSH